MTTNSSFENPLAALPVGQGPTGRLVFDPVTATRKFIPNDEERERIERFLAQKLERTVMDYAPRFARWDRLQTAYDSEIASSGDQLITLPFCKRDTNQQLGWLTNAVFSKDPVVSVAPKSRGMVSLPIPTSVVDQVTGQQVHKIDVQQISSVDAAKNLTDLMRFEFSDVVNFEDEAWNCLANTVILGIGWLKVAYDYHPKNAIIRQAVAGQNGQTQVVTKVDGVFPDGPETFFSVDPRNILMPAGERDPQKASLLFEKILESQMDFEAKLGAEYDLAGAPFDDQVRDLLTGATTVDEKMRERAKAEPVAGQETYEIHFFWPVKISADEVPHEPDQTPPAEPPSPEQDARSAQPVETPALPAADATGEPLPAPEAPPAKPNVEETLILDLCARFHRKTGRLLSLYDNPFLSRSRPLFPVFMRQKANEFDGYSTVEDVLPMQNLASQLFHLQIQNAVQSNIKVIFVKKGSTSAKMLAEKGGVIKPGMVLYFDNKDDINPVPLGSPIQSMSAEISFLNSEAEKMSVINEYDRGFVPSRTAAAAISQSQSLAKMQPGMVLRSIRRHMRPALVFFLQVLAQFYPNGRRMPFIDPNDAAVTEKIIRFPLEQLSDWFDIHLTATAEDESDQGRFEKAQMLNGQIQTANTTAIQLLGLAMQPTTPQPMQELLFFLLGRAEKALGSQIGLMQKDSDQWVLSPQMISMTMQALQGMAAQAAQQQQMQGGPSGNQVSGAGGGGSVPPGQNAAPRLGPMGGGQGDSSLPPRGVPPETAALLGAGGGPNA